MAFKEPKDYVIYCVVDTKPKEYVYRVGMANDVKEAKEIILSDSKFAKNSFGGMIEAITTPRTYRVFHAKWTEVTI